MPALYAGQYGPEGLQFPDGRPARNTPIEVRRPNGLLAVLYSDPQHTEEVENPISTDSYGNLIFFAAPGEYRIVINGAEIPVLVPIHPADPGFGIGGGGLGGYVHEQSVPASQFQIQHPLSWHPGGVTCLLPDGGQIDPDHVGYPAPGVLEVFFQVTFSGKVYLS